MPDSINFMREKMKLAAIEGYICPHCGRPTSIEFRDKRYYCDRCRGYLTKVTRRFEEEIRSHYRGLLIEEVR